MSHKTKTKLLEAAERIVIEQGVQSLTIRRIGDLAGLNSALITYHFGGVAGLLERLCEDNIAPMREAWRSLDAPLPSGEGGFELLIRRWLAPLLFPAAFTPTGRALSVIDEIVSRENGVLSEKLTQEMTSLAAKIYQLALPYCQHLAPHELMARLRFIASASLGPPPRSRLRREGVFANSGEEAENQLIRFAQAALSPAYH
ncbi:TetR family transcriptional regulator [Altererythrobacter indicus]|uniref:TetR family transcriptional regulator n=1 Tax=Altericroceibacterium indicum TaxID=374177 RepID=A0A845A8N8_9SPHN|nr:TetR family transcriptional regulator [Altericroceibacterium indicum]